ncbi:hypothetical protein SLEP1_g44420 [Rubroshorea leprosula]|uniref:BED-type domain-containing protein n=1 Tax=Rubroshorea leprosula TaxID=152421 RepID=A0AAV5LG93_9ROSI|nr:hypothetical protein SLEP1_g44420 [Rubroshorea leprosula]
MASVAEIHDILQNICRQYEVVDILTWANPVCSAYLHHEKGSPLLLKTILCFEDAACCPNLYMFDAKNLFKWQYKEEGIVGKALKCNRPFYVPVIDSEGNVCPYIHNYYKKEKFLGALAIKLSSAYSSCGDYVVEFFFQRSNVTLETQKWLVHRIIDYMKDATPRFVTYGDQDPLVELPEHDTADSDTMLVRSNPPSQSTSDFNLNLTNQTVGNAMDGQLPMQQLSFVDQLHYTGVLDAMPTQGNLQTQSTDAFGSKGKTFVVNPRDGNVLQWPHEKVPPIQPHISATSNIETLRENTVAPPIGDFNLNGRISSSGNNQIVEYHVTDMQMPHKQGNKRQRMSRSDVWNHYEKEEVVDEELLAKCKYCDFKTDGSSKKGTSHLRKHFEHRHRKIKNVHQSSNLPSKNLEPQCAFKEKYVLDEGKIHLDMARVIIKYKLPLSIIHDEHLKNLFKMLSPEFEFQSEKDIEPHILHVYNEEKHKLCKYFDKFSSRSNLTINLWEDDTKEIVNCCLTVQFIDDSWTLKKKILSFERLEHDFDAASLCEIFKRVLFDWNIKEKTCSLTFHSSLSNVEIVHDEKIWPSGIFYLSYDKCIRDINCMIADISLKGIYQVYEKMNHQENRGYTLMNVECSNNWRICSLILAIVAILHPSLKLDFVEFVYKEIYEDAIAKEHLDKISNFLRNLYDKYASSCSNHTKFTIAIRDPCSSSLANIDDKVFDSFRKYKVSKSRPELCKYLEEDEGSTMEINILNWWCNNSSRFPTLGMMARDFLAIPLSTIMSSSAFAKDITKIISNNGHRESHILNAIICCQDWLESTKPSCDEKCDEKLMRKRRAWSKKFLLSDFTHEDLELLGKWKNRKITGQCVGLDEEFKVQDKFLAPLVIPLVDDIIQGTPQTYYIGDEVVNKYFLLLMKRSKENPSMFLKNTSLDSSTTSLLLGGDQPSVPTWINPVEQISTCKLFLPLCFLDHWTLFYVDIKDQKFVWLDSRKDSEMQMPSNYERIPEWFKGSLLPAMGLNNAMDWPFFVPRDIPKQENGIDCGIFVMKYADCLTHTNCIGFPFSQDNMPHFRERIFLDIYNGGIHVPKNL